MNRLQKKCVIATAGIHLLLLTILIVGPAFFNPQPKPDNTQLLDVISYKTVDDALNSGVRDATPPAPTPAVTPPPLPTPPTPMVQPPPPVPKPVVTPPPTISERLEKFFTPEPKPEPVKPVSEKAEPKPHQIQVNTQLVTRVPPRNPTANSKPNSKPDNSATLAAIKNLRKNLSPGPVEDVPGTSSAAATNYKDALATIYYNAWVTPEGVANDEADTMVKITVARDGTVVTSRIVTPCGNAKVDDSVRRALNRVSSVGPLPDQSKSEQEFTIDFNLKTKQMLE